MKQKKSWAILTIAAIVGLFLLSCNGGGKKKESTTVVDTTVAKVAAPTPVAKLEQVFIIQHKVANFMKWKPVFDANDSAQRAAGLTNYILGRGIKDSNWVVIILKMADVEKAKAFAASVDLKDKMKKGGVLGIPGFIYLKVVMNDTSNIEQIDRLMMTHRVKDWDSWKKEFDAHQSIRNAAGLMDRGVGYSVDDNHMVTIVQAVTDMKNAQDFLRSSDLKERMEKAGVEGATTSVLYKIVQKY